MHILAHGIDLVDCSRIEALIKRHGDRFIDRIFTKAEHDYAVKNKNYLERLAGRFAAKEAVLKAIGTGWRGRICWTDIEVINTPLGQPRVHLSGQVQAIAERLGITQMSISITHTADFAIASAVALAESHE